MIKMIEERKTEEFEDDRKKWKIYFDLENNLRNRGDSTILVSFIHDKHLSEKDIEDLKQDLKDLGKLRIIKQGKEFLGE